MSQRDAVYTLSLPWLRVGAGERYLYNLGLASDALLQKMNEAMLARMPGLGTTTALPYLGADRVMVQGPGEADSAFSARLTRAYETWQHAGSRPAVLGQALGYVASQDAVFGADEAAWPVGTIVRSSGGGAYSSWSTYVNTDDFAAADPMNLRVAPANWNWDGVYIRPQAFLILYFPLYNLQIIGSTATVSSVSGGFATITGLTGVPTDITGHVLQLYNTGSAANTGFWQVTSRVSATSVVVANSGAVAPDANSGSISWVLYRYQSVGPTSPFGTPGVTIGGDDSVSIGLNVSSGYVKQLQALVRLWKSAGTFYPNIIFSFEASAVQEFDPFGNSSANPDGNWGTWAKVVDGVNVPSRITVSSASSTGKFNAYADGSATYYPDCYLPSGT